MRTRRNLSICIIIALFSLAMVDLVSGSTITVCLDGTADYTSIQAAINVADTGDEIEVWPGTYYENINLAGKSIWLFSSAGPEATEIHPECGTAIICTHMDLEGQQSIVEGFTIIGGTGIGSPSRAGGMYIAESTPIVNNCIFTQNTASIGGGMYIENGTPTILNCTFISNCSNMGGGICVNNCSPTIQDCTFVSNAASSTCGEACYQPLETSIPIGNPACGIQHAQYSGGGGMYTYISNVTVENCAFIDNSVDDKGGGMCTHLGSPTIFNCIFGDNEAYSGGGMFNHCSGPTVVSCTFNNNTASGDMWGGGGGISNVTTPLGSYYYGCTRPWIMDDSLAVIINCVFNGNSANRGGGIDNIFYYTSVTNCTFNDNQANVHGGAISFSSLSSPTPYLKVYNCILWDNAPSEIYTDNLTSVEVSYSSVKGPWSDMINVGPGLPPPPPPPLDWPGVGNIGSDPLFVDPSEGDYHLLPTSPCIDTGHNGTLPPWLTQDLDGNPRIINGNVDMGAYEAVNTPEKVLEYIAETIAVIEPENLNNPNSSKALTNKINETLAMIEEELYEEALAKLQNDILKKTDGCIEIGKPDKNDWIITCEDQANIYALIIMTIELLEQLL